jgi:hypothetical protein
MRESEDKKWNKRYEQLVEFKRKHDHCRVPKRYREDMSLGAWVGNQRRYHVTNKIPIDRKELLDEIGFVWKVRAAGNYKRKTDNETWHLQYEKMAEFKRKNGHCLVRKRHHEDVSLGTWVSKQRGNRAKNKIRPDRKGLLDEIGFAWKADTVSARSSTTDVSCR